MYIGKNECGHRSGVSKVYSQRGTKGTQGKQRTAIEANYWGGGIRLVGGQRPLPLTWVEPRGCGQVRQLGPYTLNGVGGQTLSGLAGPERANHGGV